MNDRHDRKLQLIHTRFDGVDEPGGSSGPSRNAAPRRRAGEWLRVRAAEATDNTRPDWPPDWLAAGVLFAAVATLITAITVGARLVPDRVDWLATRGLTRAITDPVRSYLAGHATALPLSPDAVFTAWAVAGVGLFVLAAAGAAGARAGWVLIGIATTAAAYAATPAPSAALAAGITALVWAALSVVALRTLPRREILFPPPSRGSDAPDTPHTTEMLVKDPQTGNSHPYGRGLVVTVAGDSPHELEQAALRQATEFFGPDVELDINTSYTTHPARGSADSQGKLYRARITVREVAPAGRP